MFLKGFEPPCRLTGRTFQKGDYVIQFPPLPIARDDPLWEYNEWPMLRGAFDKWEHREALLVHWREFVRRNVARLHRTLIDRADYLVLLGWDPSTIGLFFLEHGFNLFVLEDDWPAFKNFIKRPQPTGELHLPNSMQIAVGVEGKKVKIAYESLSLARGKRDRVLLGQMEWESLERILQKIDQLIQRKK